MSLLGPRAMSAFPSCNPVFHDEDAARAAIEALRWPAGPICSRCHVKDDSYEIGGEKQSHRAGLRHCKSCRRQFSATVGTALERTRVSYVNWMRLAYLLSRKDARNVSVPEIVKALNVPYKTAERMLDRIADVLITYKGLLNKHRFGKPVTDYVLKARGPQPRLRSSPNSNAARDRANVAQRYAKWKERLKLNPGATPNPIGVLCSMGDAAATTKNLDRIERLLMVILGTDEKEVKAAGKKRRTWDRHRSQLYCARVRLPNRPTKTSPA